MQTRSIALIAALSFSVSAADAQQLEFWGEVGVGPWDVMVDSALGDGCLILGEFEGDVQVRIGLDRNVGAGYITLFNYRWGNIEEGEQYPITFDLDGALFEGVANGLYLNDVPGADIYFDNEDFFWAIADKYVMTIYNVNGESVDAIDLLGTRAGLDAVLDCQDDIG